MKPSRTQRGPSHLAQAKGGLLLYVAACALLPIPLWAQTHKVAATEKVLRAVAVYEWTGEMAKPTASRLIPVSLFIDGKFQDADVYLARPVPFALDTGNVYEIDRAGVALGTLDLAFARHLVAPATAITTYDDGWFGYGKFFPPAPQKVSTLKPSKTPEVINGFDEDDDRPHFSARSATPGSGDAATTTAGTSAPSDTPADDPNRPTLHRSTSTSDQTASSNSGDTPANDPDRPTLRRHSPDKTTADQTANNDEVASLNDDPNRPLLHRGKPTAALTEADLPKLTGLPGDLDLHQMVAVSDAANRTPHDFSRAWQDEAEHQAILARMQAAARAQLAVYEAANAQAANPAPTPAAPAPPAPRKTTGKQPRTVTPPPPPPPAPPEPLLDEQLMGYMLSYGGAPTYVYSAHTNGLGPVLRFVTMVAQIDMNGDPQIAIKSVTDAAHLDRTPRLKLVDVVDADASNRASLLFELRAQNSRQFALYRVIGARAEQTFVTGSTQ